MTSLLILLSCAHHRLPKTAALNGGWSHQEYGLFIGVEGAETTPAVWVSVRDGEEIWRALEPRVLEAGGLQFRTPDQDDITLALIDKHTATLTISRAGRSEQDVLDIVRTLPRSRAELEQAIAELAEQERILQTARHVDELRTAALAYGIAFDVFVPAAVWPRPVTALTPDPMPGSEDGGYDHLGWYPGEAVRGTFMIEVAEDGSDFTVHGWQDLDGDGVPAHWTATKDAAAARVSEEGIQ